jgi:hypothetical protein
MGHTPSFNLLGMTPKDTNAANLVVNSTLTQMSLSGANVLLSPGSDVVNNNAPTVYNPGVKGTASSYYQAFAGQDGERDALDFAEQVLGNVKKSDIRIVDEDELCVLGDTLLTLASNLAVQNRDLVIFPIRAGHRIRQVLDGMLEIHPPFESVEFSEAASHPRDHFFLELIAQAIRKHNRENADFRVAVVDAGDSGEGTKKMLQLLREIHERFYRRQLWRVNCHVIHEHGESWNFKQYERHDGGFPVLVDTYRTLAGKRLLDDWVAAIGMAKVRRLTPGGVVSLPEVIESVAPAAVVIKSKTGFEAVASKVGSHAANQVISRFVLDAMATSNELRRIPELDRWKD